MKVLVIANDVDTLVGFAADEPDSAALYPYRSTGEARGLIAAHTAQGSPFDVLVIELRSCEDAAASDAASVDHTLSLLCDLKKYEALPGEVIVLASEAEVDLRLAEVSSDCELRILTLMRAFEWFRNLP